MRIIQVLPALNAGGVERSTLEIAAAIGQAGHHSEVMSAGGMLVEELRALGTIHHDLPVGQKNPLVFRHVRALRRIFQGADIVHARSRLPAWLCRLALRGMRERPRFVTTLHGLNSVSRYSGVMVKSDHVIAVSETVARYWRQHYPMHAWPPVTVIPRGIDPQQYHPEFRPSRQWFADWYQQFPELQQHRQIVLVGRLSRLKGHQRFLEMLRELPEDVHGVIVGGEEAGREAYASEIRERVAHWQLQGRVHFTGHRSDSREIIAQSDVLVSLSQKPEAFGRTVLEALTLGTPVVAENQGGVAELLAHFYPKGAIAKPSPDALARACVQAMATAYKGPLEHPYTLQNMQNRTLDCYREIGR